MLDGICAHCAKHTHFTARIAHVPAVYPVVSAERDGYYRNLTPLDVEIAATCDNCRRFNCCKGRVQLTDGLKSGSSVQGSLLDTIADEIVDRQWSPPALLPVHTSFLPAGVAGFLQEAHDAMSIGAHRAVLLLVRRTIEATARDKAIENGSLVQKINRLHENGHLRSGARDMSHTLRILGNDMAHGAIDIVPSEEDALACVDHRTLCP